MSDPMTNAKLDRIEKAIGNLVEMQLRWKKETDERWEKADAQNAQYKEDREKWKRDHEEWEKEAEAARAGG